MKPEAFVERALSGVDDAWIPILTAAWEEIPLEYRREVATAKSLVPKVEQIFEPFRKVKPSAVTVIFVAESPYPQAGVANGQVFHPGQEQLWSKKGFSAHVNRYGSLATLLRMLLRAEGIIQQGHRRGRDIARGLKVETNLRKVDTVNDLFARLYTNGVLLLNATPILRCNVAKDAKAWQPFNLAIIRSVTDLAAAPPNVVLAGELAGWLKTELTEQGMSVVLAAHPASRRHRIERFVEYSDLHAVFSRLEIIFHTTGDSR
ncbi:hypothetical protein HL658_03525 [Azospirillum sp. RWY-5-1]|uniref:Uracil-DNA glycosylase n=1 Tax=Azospirillum oleiclasticum TaxID=2735135 RepID=A0ABX2T6J0_9PROT|nr:hypothetical protein [Azospirillum oleiclasticum]NYZ11607.1 hypothetical protein [Azospirillum oleiclasticum]NYZ18768.1 hypothetical protein [Azospirillum oleiclasticum]